MSLGKIFELRRKSLRSYSKKNCVFCLIFFLICRNFEFSKKIFSVEKTFSLEKISEKELDVGELNSFPWICISGVVHDPGDFSTPKRVKNNSSSAVSPSGSDGGASDTSGESSGPAFSWKDYLTETKSEAAPPSCFKQVRLLPIPPNYLNAFFGQFLFQKINLSFEAYELGSAIHGTHFSDTFTKERVTLICCALIMVWIGLVLLTMKPKHYDWNCICNTQQCVFGFRPLSPPGTNLAWGPKWRLATPAPSPPVSPLSWARWVQECGSDLTVRMTRATSGNWWTQMIYPKLGTARKQGECSRYGHYSTTLLYFLLPSEGKEGTSQAFFRPTENQIFFSICEVWIKISAKIAPKLFFH